MHILLDTNVVVSAEPTSAENLEPTAVRVAELLRLGNAAGQRLFVHPASLREMRGDRDALRRDTRAVLSGKYSTLPDPPDLHRRYTERFGTPDVGTHDHVDALLISAVLANAVSFLVTEDQGLRRKARGLELETRVLSVDEALAALRALFPTVRAAPPSVMSTFAHRLNPDDPVFDSLAEAYPGFKSWLARAQTEHRRTWVINRDGAHAGVCISKDESAGEHGLSGRLLKLCTFKIAEHARGFRYGELLLKSVFDYVQHNAYDHMYVEVFDRQSELMRLLDDFGFERSGTTTRGEQVMARRVRPASDAARELRGLAFHKAYGPRYFDVESSRAYVVPVQPRYQEMLFPEAAAQGLLPLEDHPFGNSIRKAYLCHATLKRIPPSAVLLFYRSDDTQAVDAVGIVEATFRSRTAREIIERVARRTVYSAREIERLATREVLTILFRQARILEQPWTLNELIDSKLIRAAPQSITRVRVEGMRTLRARLGQR